MKLTFIPGKQTQGVCVNHTSEETEKYLPAVGVLAHVQQYSDAVGREPSIITVYNEHGGGLTFPVEMCEAIRRNGKIPCLMLWPDQSDAWDGVPVPEHTLNALASGASDGLLDTLAAKLANFGSPLILGMDEPSGHLWGHPSQGTPVELPALFVAFWKRLHGIVSAIAPHATFFLRGAPGWGDPDDANNPNRWKVFRHWWPGAEFVDIVGMNAMSYGVQTNGTVLWPKETSPGDVWTAGDAVGQAMAEVAMLPGADALPLSIGYWCAQDPADTGQLAERTRLSQMTGMLETTRACWLDLWADESYVRGVDVTQFPAVLAILKRRFQRPRFTSQIGVA